MKDIDFLPDWYKLNKRRQVACRTQYVTLAGILAVMVVWNFVVGRSISMAEAQIEQMAVQGSHVGYTSKEFDSLKVQIRQLQEQASTIDKVDARINVAAVLGELSCLMDESVVLSKVDLISEKFTGTDKTKRQAAPNSVVRAAMTSGSKSRNVPAGDVRFKVMISGVAARSSDVMSLVSRLEDSEYFCHVELSYSRDSQIRTGINSDRSSDADVRSSSTAKTNPLGDVMPVSEFEISCHLANYLE